MLLFRSVLAAGVLVVAVGIALSAAADQGGDRAPTGKADAGSPVARQVYTVRGGSAKELANALILHFKTEPTFLAIPGAGSKTLLLSGPKALLQDALAVLQEMDRPARSVHIEVLLLDLVWKTSEDDDPGDRDQLGTGLSGSVSDVTAKIRQLQQRGVISSSKHLHLTVLEGESAKTQVSENKPFVIGVSSEFGNRDGPVSRNLTYRNVGTILRAIKPEIGTDGRIEVDVQVEDSQMSTPGGGAAIGTDENGTAIPATEFVTTTFESRLKIRPGQVTVAQALKAESQTKQNQKVILVSASTDEANTANAATRTGALSGRALSVAELDQEFYRLSNGKEVWVRAEIADARMRATFDRAAQQLAITNGQITRQQFDEYYMSRTASRSRAGRSEPSLFIRRRETQTNSGDRAIDVRQGLIDVRNTVRNLESRLRSIEARESREGPGR